MATISIKIPDDLASRPDALARAENASRSARFRQALADTGPLVAYFDRSDRKSNHRVRKILRPKSP